MQPPPDTLAFGTAAHGCAMTLLHNAAYIQKELPRIHLPDPLRADVQRLCETWVGIKHDLIGALGDLAATLRETVPDPAAIDRHCGVIRSMLDEILEPTDRVVHALSDAAGRDPSCFLANLLVMESAANVIGAIP